MRKLFLLIPALVLSLVINATSTTISPESATSDNNIRAAFNGTADTIYLNPGEYIQENQIHFKRSAVLIAVDKSNKPIIKLKYYCDLINENSKIFVDGLIFDGSVSGQQCVRPYDAATGKELHFNDCEFRNFAKTAISGDKEDCALDSCVVNNCKFINGNRSCIFMQNANLVGVKVTNSTFANITNVSGGEYASPIDVRSTSANVLIDHCTMYNCATIDANYNYINVASTSDVIVSNSIFASAEGYNCCGTYLKAGGSVANCLTYNLTNWQGANENYGHVASGGATILNCVKSNPLFKDAANGDFSLYASSPARGAGLAGSDLGDPRWAKALAPIAIPATLVPFDALLSEKASIIQSDPDSIFLQTESKTVIEWAKWKISVAESGLYDFTAYAKRTGASGSQKLQIVVLNSAENDTLKNKSDNSVPNEGTISSGAVNLVAGNIYVVKVFNNYDWAKSKLIKVEAAYAGGKTIAIPDTLWPVDAIKSEYAFVNEDGELRFTDDSHDGYVTSQWGKWNIHLAKDGLYNFTLYANSDNSHHYYLSVLNPDESQIEKFTLDGSSGQALTKTTDDLQLSAGDYIIKIENFTNNSHGRVIKIAANYEGGAVSNIPGQLLGEDALLYKSGSKYMIRTDEGYLKSSNNGSPTTEWAVWNITASAGALNVTLNLDPVTSSGHNYRVELYQGAELKDYTQELESAEESAAVHTKGNIALEKTLVVPADGTYTIKLVNRTQWSSMILQGITFEEVVAPTVVALDEMAEDNSAWVANVGGDPVNVQLTRTFKGGVYNSICVPFAASMSKIKAAFGDDVVLKYLSETSLEGDMLNLVFEDAPDFYQGTPYLIMPSADVVNPEFEGVELLAEEGNATGTAAVDFIGTFVKKEVAANASNLYLGMDNKLYFSENAVTIKGMRAYFHVKGAAAAAKRARIIMKENGATAIDLVNDEHKAIKRIENGQVVILRDGIRYNVMGTKLQ